MKDERILDGPIDPSARPEMQRLFAIARVDSGTSFLVESTPAERVLLARRMGVPAIHALTCRFDLRRDDGDAIEAHGLLRARVRQVCVVSLDPFDASLEERFDVRFVPAGTESPLLDVEAEDEIAYEGGVLDLGEAASEQLALALDPFPRKDGAVLPEMAAERETNAFAALARLRPSD